MVLNLLDKHHEVVVFNRSPEKTKEVATHGASPAFSVQELVAKLPAPRIVWLMVTAGQPVDDMISALLPLLSKGDVLVDGGNSYFDDSIAREKRVAAKGVLFVDCGTSGGMSGAREGACMMVGGSKQAFALVEPFVKDMCVPQGYCYAGSSGAGHFVKMVHNGIEYGMMGAIGEGMQAILKHQERFGTDLRAVATVYAHGSIIESRLVSWLQESYEKKGYLESIEGSVPKGETEEEMKKLTQLADTPILKTAIFMREQTRVKPTYAGKIMASLRNLFGGHSIAKKK